MDQAELMAQLWLIRTRNISPITYGLRQTKDQTIVDNVRESLLWGLSFDPVNIDDLNSPH